MIHGAFSENLPACVIKYIPLAHPGGGAVDQTPYWPTSNAKNRPGAGFVPVPA